MKNAFDFPEVPLIQPPWRAQTEPERPSLPTHANHRDVGMEFAPSCSIFIFIITPRPYLRMELARRLRASALEALASATRLAKIWAYSF